MDEARCSPAGDLFPVGRTRLFAGADKLVACRLRDRYTYLVSSDIRFDLIHHLSDLYVVYNDTRDTMGHQVRERAFTIKLTNLFNF